MPSCSHTCQNGKKCKGVGLRTNDYGLCIRHQRALDNGTIPKPNMKTRFCSFMLDNGELCSRVACTGRLCWQHAQYVRNNKDLNDNVMTAENIHEHHCSCEFCPVRKLRYIPFVEEKRRQRSFSADGRLQYVNLNPSAIINDPEYLEYEKEGIIPKMPNIPIAVNDEKKEKKEKKSKGKKKETQSVDNSQSSQLQYGNPSAAGPSRSMYQQPSYPQPSYSQQPSYQPYGGSMMYPSYNPPVPLQNVPVAVQPKYMPGMPIIAPSIQTSNANMSQQVQQPSQNFSQYAPHQSLRESVNPGLASQILSQQNGSMVAAPNYSQQSMAYI